MQHRTLSWALPVSLVFITCIAYAPSLTYPFQFDDLANIVKYFDIRNKHFLDLFFSGSRWVSYWLNTLYYALSHFNPLWYRVGNLISHIIAGILVYSLICRLGALRRDFSWRTIHTIATGATLLFLVHPVQTQTVSYVIQGQLEGLATLCMLAMVHLFISATHAATQLMKGLFLGAMLFLVPIACGTKEIVIVTPALLLLIDWFFVARASFKKIVSHWWIHVPVSMAILGVYIYFLKPSFFLKAFGFAIETRSNIGNMLTDDPTTMITPYFYTISQFKVLVHYLWIFLWPWAISVDYDWKLSAGFFSADVLFPFVILALIAFWLYKRMRRSPTDWVTFGFLWFFICILPRASIIPSTELIADYKTYAASIGLFCAIAYGFAGLFAHYSERMLMGVYAIAALFFVATTYARNTVWRSGEEFWENVIANAPRKARAYNNYGVALSEKGKFEAAVEQFKKAVMLDRFYPDPWVNVAVAYGALKNLDKAIAAIKQAILMQPYYPENYNNLASFLMQKQEYEEAERMLKHAIELRPHYGKAYFNLGRLYLDRNRMQEAWESFRRACEIGDFDNETGFSAFGMVSAISGNYEAAARAYGRALALNPASLDYRFSLANALFFLKQHDEARVHYEYLVRVRPQEMRYAYNLAETYRALNKFDKAIEWYKRAEQLGSTSAELPGRIAACLAQLQGRSPTPSQ